MPMDPKEIHSVLDFRTYMGHRQRHECVVVDTDVSEIDGIWAERALDTADPSAMGWPRLSGATQDNKSVTTDSYKISKKQSMQLFLERARGTISIRASHDERAPLAVSTVFWHEY
jgi:hypothetical protein